MDTGRSLLLLLLLLLLWNTADPFLPSRGGDNIIVLTGRLPFCKELPVCVSC